MQRPVVHVNFSRSLGGAEIYARFLLRALEHCGWQNELFVARESRIWNDAALDGITKREFDAEDARGIASAMPRGSLVVIHAPTCKPVLDAVAAGRLIIGLAHQAVYSQAIPGYYRAADVLFPVSGHVITTLRGAGFDRIYTEPLYGIADLGRARGLPDAPILRGRLCDWDRRKMRDRVMEFLAPAAAALRHPLSYAKRPGFTLGIVSRIAPLKQFARMFAVLAPVIARHPGVNIEIFGASVGYAPLRDLRRAVAPISRQVRFWGHQDDVERVYAGIDYLLTGLPEREALGLNVIEAQNCGVPVLAPRAPPFTETIVDRQTGYLFSDPRDDGGVDFDALLNHIEALPERIDPRLAQTHLARFSADAFAQRAGRAIRYADEHFDDLRRRDA